jgi:outer membrane protein OmpA-like peptidoglycan-associated protein
VRAFLVDLGVPASRLVVSGFGAERPAVVGRSRAARAHNRRVDLLLSPSTTTP